MNVTQFLQRVRDRIDEATANVWSDAELVRYGNAAVKFATRRHADVDVTYQNYEFNILSAAAISLNTDLFAYTLPPWVYRITTVKETAGSSSRANSFIPARTIYNQTGRFWTWDRFNRIRVAGNSAVNLTIECTKDPAAMLKGIVVAAPAPTSTTVTFLHTAVTPTGVDVETEANYYANAMVEFTGVNAASHLMSSVTARVSTSIMVEAGGLFYTTLTFEEALSVTPVANDTFELRTEVQPSHDEMVILWATRKAFLKKSNLQALQALAPEIMAEELRFMEGITPRQDQEQEFIGMGNDNLRGYDEDSDVGGSHWA